MDSSSSNVRPPLTRNMTVEDFRDYYWLKSDLEAFCREHGLSSSGGKREIAGRIEHFLRTGHSPPLARPSARLLPEARRVNSTRASDLSMSTRAPAGFRCTQEARAFFEEHLGPSFRFTVTLQKYIKEHPGVMFGEICVEWKRQEAARKSGSLRPDIAPQFQYNQFTRDYFADPKNEGKSRRDCIEEWKRVRAGRGEKKYKSGLDMG